MFPVNPHPELMVDIETLSTKPNAAILSIAAIQFDSKTGLFNPTPFYLELDHTTFDDRFDRDPKTITWWEKQSQPMPEGTTDAQTALRAFADYLIETRPSAIWANSPSFDLVILRTAFDAYGLAWPVPFWNERDVRTLKALCSNPKFAPTHDAIADCKLQIHVVCNSIRQLTGPA